MAIRPYHVLLMAIGLYRLVLGDEDQVVKVRSQFSNRSIAT